MNLNIKIGRKTWLFAGISVLFIFVIALGIYRTRQIAEQERLRDELTIVNNRLAALELEQLTIQQEQVLDQIRRTTESVESLKIQIASPIDSIDASDNLFALAREIGVEVSDLSTDEAYKVNLAGVPCLVMPVSATLTGDWEKLVQYLYTLKTAFAKVLIDRAALDIGNETPTLKLTLLVYTYRGS